jgi:hypothetical protein
MVQNQRTHQEGRAELLMQGHTIISKEEAINQVAMLDLDPIQDRLVRVNKFEGERLQRAMRMYRKFLALMVMYPDLLISPPSEDADEVWHAHIIHTKKYAADCQTLFGTFRHHNPMPSTDPIQQQADKNMQELWNKHEFYKNEKV